MIEWCENCEADVEAVVIRETHRGEVSGDKSCPDCGHDLGSFCHADDDYDYS